MSWAEAITALGFFAVIGIGIWTGSRPIRVDNTPQMRHLVQEIAELNARLDVVEADLHATHTHR